MPGVLVHEWIAQDGGSENVLQAMSEVFPDAPVVCLWNDSVGRFDERRLRETWLSRTPLRRSKALALPLTTLTWRLVRDRGYDWALISSHAFAHHARFRGADPALRRFVYVHTPARYVWTPELDARGAHWSLRLAARPLKAIDRKRATEGAVFAANSRYVRDRVRQCWGVDAQVLYPPVRVEEIQAEPDWAARLSTAEADRLGALPDGFVLGASRFIPYKQLELVIATGEAVGRPVVLAGAGPERPALEERARRATVPVQFVDAPSDAMLFALFQRTALYVFPAVEDFGIMPVEAMAAGAPVLVRDTGGCAESVGHGTTGALIPFADPAEMRAGAEVAMGTDRAARTAHARTFGARRFSAEIADWVAAG